MERAVRWKVELEAWDSLKQLAWDSLLPEIQIGQWRIVPLTDAWQLRREALTRRHCADQYVDECLTGDYRLFSVRNNHGKSVATIGWYRAQENELDVLCEAHDQLELQRAIDAGCKIIGINSRNLHTFDVTLDTALCLPKKFRLTVSE